MRGGGSRGRSCGLDRWFDIVNLYELLDGNKRKFPAHGLRHRQLGQSLQENGKIEHKVDRVDQLPYLGMLHSNGCCLFGLALSTLLKFERENRHRARALH